MKLFKGFNKDMKCRGFQFEKGREYEEREAELCKKGFHACKLPQDVFFYYPPSSSVYHRVELDEVEENYGEDSKVVGKKIKIGSKIDPFDLVYEAVDTFLDRHCPAADDKEAVDTGNHSAVTKSEKNRAIIAGFCSSLKGGFGNYLKADDQSALCAGEKSAIVSRNCCSNRVSHNSVVDTQAGSAVVADSRCAIKSSDGSAIVASDFGAVKSGCYSAILSDNNSVVESGENCCINANSGSVARAGFSSAIKARDKNNIRTGPGSSVRAGDSNVIITEFNCSVKAGDCNTITSGSECSVKAGEYSVIKTGDNSVIKAGDYSSIKTGEFSSVYAGEKSRVSGGIRTVFFIAVPSESRSYHAVVDGETIKPDVFYELKNGEFVESDNQEQIERNDTP